MRSCLQLELNAADFSPNRHYFLSYLKLINYIEKINDLKEYKNSNTLAAFHLTVHHNNC